MGWGIAVFAGLLADKLSSDEVSARELSADELFVDEVSVDELLVVVTTAPTLLPSQADSVAANNMQAQFFANLCCGFI